MGKSWRINDENEFYEKAEKYINNHLEEFTDNLEKRIRSKEVCDYIFKRYKAYKANSEFFCIESKISNMLDIVLKDVYDWNEFSLSFDSKPEDIMLRVLISNIFKCDYVCLSFISKNPLLSEEFLEDCIYASSDLFSFDEWDDDHVKAVTNCAASGYAEDECSDLLELYDNSRLISKPVNIRLDLEEIMKSRHSEYFRSKYRYMLNKVKRMNYVEKEILLM